MHDIRLSTQIKTATIIRLCPVKSVADHYRVYIDKSPVVHRERLGWKLGRHLDGGQSSVRF